MTEPQSRIQARREYLLFRCKPTALNAVHLLCLFPYTVSSCPASFPVSDAAGHNRVDLGAGLDHLSRHGGKQRPRFLSRSPAAGALKPPCWGPIRCVTPCYTWRRFQWSYTHIPCWALWWKLISYYLTKTVLLLKVKIQHNMLIILINQLIVSEIGGHSHHQFL